MMVQVNLGDRSYPIFIGEGMLNDLASVIGKYVNSEKLFVITDETVRSLYIYDLDRILSGQGYKPVILSVPAGEGSKSLHTADELYTELIRHNADRSSFIIAFGGGVVGDLAGFIAATFMRGVPFAQVPTTILSQVDSSVGGKVGINHPMGKNLIGAFYQPAFVLIDPLVLKTLDARQRCAGMAEVVKYALIRDRELFSHLAAGMQRLLALSDLDLLQQVLATCCQIKAGIVSHDEKEQGLRAILNFGHTLGHALESLTHFKVFLHGEAIAHGMRAALFLSHAEGNLHTKDFTAALNLLDLLAIPSLPPHITCNEIWNAMQHDKKRSAKGQQWVLLKSVGTAFLTFNVQEKSVIDAIEFMLSERK